MGQGPRVVVALGGNALLRRGQPLSVAAQRAAVKEAGAHLAAVAASHALVVSHGNGPQIGLLALEEAAYTDAPDAPLDVLGAETQGMIGYLLEQELANLVPADRPVATLLTMVEVDRHDPAFAHPTKPIGPWYEKADADRLAAEQGWTFVADGDAHRRVVPSPKPLRIAEERPIALLLDEGCIVICAGGGGIPTTRSEGRLEGVEAVIDKDLASALLARNVDATALVLATDAPGAYLGFGGPDERLISAANPEALLASHRDEFAVGSMLPKVEAACAFAAATGHPAYIGALSDIERMLDGEAGTRIATDVADVQLGDGS